jgi:putative membrane protein
MNILFIRWLILTIAIISAAYMLDGIRVSGFFSALFTAAILGILNVFFRPVLLVLTLPINIISLGLFTFVINALMLLMASGLIPGFKVYSFGAALLGSLVISIVSWVLNSFIRGPAGSYYARMEKKNFDRTEENFSAKPDNKDAIDLKKKDDGSWE